jgi:hypothetical protein
MGEAYERHKDLDGALSWVEPDCWLPLRSMRHRILVENPEALYDFTKSA